MTGDGAVLANATPLPPRTSGDEGLGLTGVILVVVFAGAGIVAGELDNNSLDTFNMDSVFVGVEGGDGVFVFTTLACCAVSGSLIETSGKEAAEGIAALVNAVLVVVVEDEASPPLPLDAGTGELSDPSESSESGLVTGMGTVAVRAPSN